MRSFDSFCLLLTVFKLISLRLLFSNHDWFRVDLPAYLFPPINESEASIVDIDAVREVCDVGFTFLNLFYVFVVFFTSGILFL